MTRLAVNKAREDFSDTLDRVSEKGERIVLHRHGKNVAVLIPLEDLALLEEIEDRLDVEDFRAAKEEWERDGRKTIPLEDVVRDLGIKA
ncbi:MAG: type II toxin-antitoxin system prevent-host-death family antitoxin [Candidatus Binatia bacterium]